MEDRIIGTVYETYIYGRFSFLKQNREPRISKKLTDSIKSRGILVPIDIDKNYKIIDGQNRFLAAKRMNKPILYRFSLIDNGVNAVMVLNTTNHQWTIHDYIHKYVVENFDEYKKLATLQKTYSVIPMSVFAACAEGYFSGKGCVINDIRTGRFEFKSIEEYENIVSNYAEFIRITGIKGYQQTFLAYFILSVVEGFDSNRLIKTVKQNSGITQISGTRDVTTILRLFLKHYNMNLHKDSNKYFLNGVINGSFKILMPVRDTLINNKEIGEYFE